MRGLIGRNGYATDGSIQGDVGTSADPGGVGELSDGGAVLCWLVYVLAPCMCVEIDADEVDVQ